MGLGIIVPSAMTLLFNRIGSGQMARSQAHPGDIVTLYVCSSETVVIA